MTAPANDLAALLRQAVDEAESTKNGARLADYAEHVRTTLDALAAAQAENQLRRNELVEVAVKKRQFQDLLAKAEADCAALRDIAEQLLNTAENADETGYVADCGFVDLDALHEKAHAALQAADAGKPLLDELARLRDICQSHSEAMASASRWMVVHGLTGSVRPGAVMRHMNELLETTREAWKAQTDGNVELLKRAERAESELRRLQHEMEQARDINHSTHLERQLQADRALAAEAALRLAKEAMAESTSKLLSLDKELRAARQKLPEEPKP